MSGQKSKAETKVPLKFLFWVPSLTSLNGMRPGSINKINSFGLGICHHNSIKQDPQDRCHGRNN